jgi:hypothetical protein
MSGEVKRNVGDVVYEAVDANLVGGTLVESSTTATVSGLQGMHPAVDASKKVLGVVSKDCVTEANRAALESPTGPAPMSVVGIDLTIASATSAVYNDFFGKVTYTAAAVAHGARLAAAANGAVRAWLAADGADAVIGWCAQPGGVSAAGGWALARIRV